MARMHWVGLWLAVGSVLGLIAWSAVRPAGSRGPTPLTTAGMLMGTLVGGSATIDTAQLAFQYGLSAWWFTLGSGIACLVLAFGYAVPLRRSGAQTLVGIVKTAYGPAVGTWASVLSAIGNFINILSQLLSATAVVAVAAPGMAEGTALGLCAGFMLLYGMGGGMRGASLAGLWKLGLLYLSMLCAGSLGDTILGFAFLSMGLRGAVLFAPLWGALRLPGKVPPAFAMAAVLLGPVGTLAARLWLPGVDPAIPAIALSWLTILLGFLTNKIVIAD